MALLQLTASQKLITAKAKIHYTVHTGAEVDFDFFVDFARLWRQSGRAIRVTEKNLQDVTVQETT